MVVDRVPELRGLSGVRSVRDRCSQRPMIHLVMHLLLVLIVVPAGVGCRSESSRSTLGDRPDSARPPGVPAGDHANSTLDVPTTRPRPIYCKTDNECPPSDGCAPTIAGGICLSRCDAGKDCPRGWDCSCIDRHGHRYTGCEPPPGFCVPAVSPRERREMTIPVP